MKMKIYISLKHLSIPHTNFDKLKQTYNSYKFIGLKGKGEDINLTIIVIVIIHSNSTLIDPLKPWKL